MSTYKKHAITNIWWPDSVGIYIYERKKIWWYAIENIIWTCITSEFWWWEIIFIVTVILNTRVANIKRQFGISRWSISLCLDPWNVTARARMCLGEYLVHKWLINSTFYFSYYSIYSNFNKWCTWTVLGDIGVRLIRVIFVAKFVKPQTNVTFKQLSNWTKL